MLLECCIAMLHCQRIKHSRICAIGTTHDTDFVRLRRT